MSTPRIPARKPRGSYHHGNLRRALVDEAVRTIGRSGVGALTLRGVGAALGVSRTALYRHFADKDALLAAVAREGFIALTAALAEPRTTTSELQGQLTAMGAAYVRFAIDHQAHYRVMFGGFLERCRDEPGLVADATAAFDVLVGMIRDLQTARLVREDDVRRLSLFVWATVHGIAMLAIDGQLGPDPHLGLALYEASADRLRAGIA
jgi:AcrR family transcriptional regulator